MKPYSLGFRLLFSTGIVLIAFFALTVAVLEKAYQRSSEQAIREKLQLQIYALLSVAEMDASLRLKMPKILREPRFANPGSGLYAVVRLSDQSLVWRSASAVGVDLPAADKIRQGEAVFIKDTGNQFALHHSIIWENEAGFERAYVFTVAEDGWILTRQVSEFRETLSSWLLGIGLLLVLVQFWVVRRGLRPLRKIGVELELIEAGHKNRLDGSYPLELTGLAGNLNALISSERAHQDRYRNTLADLAHSLKTPLAILRGAVEQPVIQRELIENQITRMNDIVSYQLQKAAAKGARKFAGKINLNQVLEKIVASLNKVYAEKNIHYQIDSLAELTCYGEEGDFYEIAGNLLDNASKWCRRGVNVSLEEIQESGVDGFSIRLMVEDDGPGIPAQQIASILQRGVRADENTEGHGIGMAVVNELVGLLGGELRGARSARLGGMQWTVLLP